VHRGEGVTAAWCDRRHARAARLLPPVGDPAVLPSVGDWAVLLRAVIMVLGGGHCGGLRRAAIAVR
jgi:hypothetical protein